MGLPTMDLGARPLQVFRYVILPLSMPGIFASFIFVFNPMIREYVTPTLVGGVRGLSSSMSLRCNFKALRFGVGSAMVIVIAGVILCLIMWLRKAAQLEKRYGG